MARALLDDVMGKRYDLIELQLAHMIKETWSALRGLQEWWTCLLLAFAGSIRTHYASLRETWVETDNEFPASICGVPI